METNEATNDTFVIRLGHNLGEPPPVPLIITENVLAVSQTLKHIPLVVNDPTGREIMRITSDRRIVFAPDVEPKDAAKVFAEYVSRAFGWDIADQPSVVL